MRPTILLTVVFALLPHERAPLAHRVVALAVLAPDPQDVEEGRRGAQTVPAVDLRVQVLKCYEISIEHMLSRLVTM